MTDGYILGSDGNGRDILTRLAYGGRISIMIAVLSAFATFFLGGAIGLVSGYAGGKVDAVIMRLVDVLLSIPGLPLLILIATLYSPGPVGSGLRAGLCLLARDRPHRARRSPRLARPRIRRCRANARRVVDRASCCGTFCRTCCRC